MKSGIYQIENQVNGNRYIGSAINLKCRHTQHFSDLRYQRHYNSHLQAAFLKYGEAAFVFSVLEYTEPPALIEREQHYLNMFAPEYNILPIAGSPLGRSCSLETRAKMSAAWTVERRQAKADRQRGSHHTEETRRRMSKAHTGKTLSQAARQKLSAAQKGRHHSAESKQKMSKAHMGQQHSEKSKRKISEATRGRRNPFFGKQHSEEARRKSSEAHRGKPLSMEHRKKISDGVKAYWHRIQAGE